MKAHELLDLRAVVEEVHVGADIEKYIAMLVHATRQDRRVAVGSSPRGGSLSSSCRGPMPRWRAATT